MNGYQHLFFLVPMAFLFLVMACTNRYMNPLLDVMWDFSFWTFVVLFIIYLCLFIPAMTNFYQHLGGLK